MSFSFIINREEECLTANPSPAPTPLPYPKLQPKTFQSTADEDSWAMYSPVALSLVSFPKEMSGEPEGNPETILSVFLLVKIPGTVRKVSRCPQQDWRCCGVSPTYMCDKAVKLVCKSCCASESLIILAPGAEDHPFVNLVNIQACLPEPVPLVAGGRMVMPTELPWLAVLSYKVHSTKIRTSIAPSSAVELNTTSTLANYATEADNLRCGGSLINEQFVLTAAHCLVDDYNRPHCYEKQGRKICADTPISFLIEDIIVHPEYKPNMNNNIAKADIALIKLNKKAKLSAFIRPICLPVERTEINITEFTTAGWGKTETNELSDVPMEVNVPYVPYKECVKLLNDFNIPKSTICAGGQINKNSCQGDSGGPLAARAINSHNTYLMGIVSSGVSRRCGNPHPSVYTDVSAHLKWILDNLEGLRQGLRTEVSRTSEGGTGIKDLDMQGDGPVSSDSDQTRYRQILGSIPPSNTRITDDPYIPNAPPFYNSPGVPSQNGIKKCWTSNDGAYHCDYRSGIISDRSGDITNFGRNGGTNDLTGINSGVSNSHINPTRNNVNNNCWTDAKGVYRCYYSSKSNSDNSGINGFDINNGASIQNNPRGNNANKKICWDTADGAHHCSYSYSYQYGQLGATNKARQLGARELGLTLGMSNTILILINTKRPLELRGWKAPVVDWYSLYDVHPWQNRLIEERVHQQSLALPGRDSKKWEEKGKEMYPITPLKDRACMTAKGDKGERSIDTLLCELTHSNVPWPEGEGYISLTAHWRKIVPVALVLELESMSSSVPQRAPRTSGLHLAHPSSLLGTRKHAHSLPPARICTWDSPATPRSELLSSAGTSGDIVSPPGTRPSRDLYFSTLTWIPHRTDMENSLAVCYLGVRETTKFGNHCLFSGLLIPLPLGEHLCDGFHGEAHLNQLFLDVVRVCPCQESLHHDLDHSFLVFPAFLLRRGLTVRNPSDSSSDPWLDSLRINGRFGPEDKPSTSTESHELSTRAKRAIRSSESEENSAGRFLPTDTPWREVSELTRVFEALAVSLASVPLTAVFIGEGRLGSPWSGLPLAPLGFHPSCWRELSPSSPVCGLSALKRASSTFCPSAARSPPVAGGAPLGSPASALLPTLWRGPALSIELRPKVTVPEAPADLPVARALPVVVGAPPASPWPTAPTSPVVGELTLAVMLALERSETSPEGDTGRGDTRSPRPAARLTPGIGAAPLASAATTSLLPLEGTAAAKAPAFGLVADHLPPGTSSFLTGGASSPHERKPSIPLERTGSTSLSLTADPPPLAANFFTAGAGHFPGPGFFLASSGGLLPTPSPTPFFIFTEGSIQTVEHSRHQGLLPKADALKKLVRRKRNQRNAAPPVPANLQTLIIPDRYKMYVSEIDIEENFLISDSGPDANRIVIFGLQHRTNNHAEAEHRRLGTELGIQHPTIWKFIDALRKVQAAKITTMNIL
uniref:Peptidase S1 domain-containing protein n=1 Tax=Timema shepardi TaxID=629360 RepID=A0A7R9ASZ6_TIMSH|nr:unnamed protein product [Timema shepardi]